MVRVGGGGVGAEGGVVPRSQIERRDDVLAHVVVPNIVQTGPLSLHAGLENVAVFKLSRTSISQFITQEDMSRHISKL